MQVKVITDLEKRAHADALVIPFWENKNGTGKGPNPATEIGSLKNYAQAPIQAKDFTGKEGELIIVYGQEPEEKRIILLGLGDKESITAEKLRCAYGLCCKTCQKRKAIELTLLIPEIEFLPPHAVAKAMAEGLLLPNYFFDLFKHDTIKEEKLKEERLHVLQKLQFVLTHYGVERVKLIKAIEDVQIIMQGVYVARDLTNGNADDVTPHYLADVAIKLMRDSTKIETKVYNEKWIQKQGMGLFLAVAKGSQHPPAFIVAKYVGNPDSTDHTVVIGKGITFDTGGLNLKPTGNIEVQKRDMAGAAVALGMLKVVAALELPLNITVVIAACENAIGSKAYKPGDVYRSASGKTVEITNTDAEGRLTLADALYYASHTLKPSRIIDLATLTGSMVVALGTEIAGMMANSDCLAEELFQAGEKTHERVWRFPLYQEYREQLRSDIADMKNAASREGGAILAALFLKDFVGEVPWAHFDIAGVAYQKEAKRYHVKQATGFGVRLLVEFFQQLAEGRG